MTYSEYKNILPNQELLSDDVPQQQEKQVGYKLQKMNVFSSIQLNTLHRCNSTDNFCAQDIWIQKQLFHWHSQWRREQRNRYLKWVQEVRINKKAMIIELVSAATDGSICITESDALLLIIISKHSLEMWMTINIMGAVVKQKNPHLH